MHYIYSERGLDQDVVDAQLRFEWGGVVAREIVDDAQVRPAPSFSRSPTRAPTTACSDGWASAPPCPRSTTPRSRRRRASSRRPSTATSSTVRYSHRRPGAISTGSSPFAGCMRRSRRSGATVGAPVSLPGGEHALAAGQTDRRRAVDERRRGRGLRSTRRSCDRGSSLRPLRERRGRRWGGRRSGYLEYHHRVR